MSIKSRIAILMALLLLVFAATGGVVRFTERRLDDERVAAARASEAQMAEHWLAAASKALPLFAADVSEAKEVARAVAASDWSRARSLLEPAVERAGMTSVWLMTEDGQLRLQIGTLPPPPLGAGEFATLVHETPRPRFFLAEHGTLAEVAARKLADRPEWVVVARVWDEAYLRHVGALMDASVTLGAPSDATMTSERANLVVLVRPLQDWQGRTIATLRIEHPIPVPERAPVLQTGTFLAFGVLLLAITVLALERWVVRPLRRISDSLTREDASAVAPLVADRSELGRVARLVQSSFEQRAALEREVGERRRAQEALEKSEGDLRRSMEERERLGRDLHDGVIQSLYAAGMGLAGIRPLLQPDQTEAAARLEQTKAALNETIHDVRNFIIGLEPEALKTQSFAQAVTRLMEIMQAIRPVQTDIAIDEATADRLSLSQRVHALQIAREAVSNALRHGSATRIGIALRSQAHFAEFEVADNGQGFDVQAAGPGRGLGNFTQRARELGGELAVVSSPGQGTTVKLTFSFHP